VAWQDRLKQGAYTGPDGTRIAFIFEDLSKTIPKKTHAFDFPSANVTYVEDNGIRGRRYPMRCFFTGDNHDIEATEFENLLAQTGPGRLEHPLYAVPGLAIPFGDITRNDKVKTEANQTVIEVTFYATIASVFPSADEDTGSAVDVAIANEAFEAQFDASIDDATPAEAANFRATMKALAAGMRSGLRAAEDGTARLTNGMDAIDSAINNGLDNAIGTPLSLGSQLRALALAPARSAALLKDRINAYASLASSIFSGAGTGTGGGVGSSESGTGVVQPGVVVPGVDSTEANAFHGNNIIAQFMVMGTAAAVAVPVEGQEYKSRQQVIEQIEELLAVYNAQVDWSDANYEALGDAANVVDPFEPVASGQGSTDTGEAAQALADVVTTTLRHLLSSAFVLPPERVHIVDRPRTVLDLCFELYGEIDSFEDFIEANDFSGDELLELPLGKRVVYYVTG